MSRKREFQFIPRIINPVKIDSVILFSADETVRNSQAVLRENMPWVDVQVVADPISISNYRSEKVTVFILDDIAMTMTDTDKIRTNNEDPILVLLSSNQLIHCSPPSVSEGQFPYTKKADLVFAFDHSEFSPDHIITSVVRAAEDRLNILKYSKARRYIFLIVDDEPRWFSQFLPLLYDIIGQRSDVMLVRTYEEVLSFLFGVEDESEINEGNFLRQGHGDDVVCVITDIYFPKGKDLKGEAGRNLVMLMHRFFPRIPIIIASKAKEADDLADIAYIMPKGDPGSLKTLSGFIHDFTGMGDFILRNPQGHECHRIRDIRKLFDILQTAEDESEDAKTIRDILDQYGQKDYFSTWLYMHGYRELGDKLRPKRDKGQRLVTTLKRHLKREILRMDYTPLLIDDHRAFTLDDLLRMLRTVDPVKIQHYSDNDIFSMWLDRKGYPELAGEFRPVHGSGVKLEETLAKILSKWIEIYKNTGKY